MKILIHLQIISAKNNDGNSWDPHLFLQNNQSSTMCIDLSNELGVEKVKNVFTKIERACVNDKVVLLYSSLNELSII